MSRKQIPKRNIDVRNSEELASMRYSRNINDLHDENLSFGDRIAEKLAGFAGSWTFIIVFTSILALWVIFNSVELFFKPFDAFPYILLNLILSCVAAIQAPIIMMSQNLQEAKERIKAEHDYQVNLKTEILIEEVLIRLGKLEENQQEIIKHLVNTHSKHDT